MKKFYIWLFVVALAFAAGPLFAQDASVDGDAAVAKEKATDSKEGAKATKAFEMGEIVVKDRAIANIEDASTTTEITEKDIKARGDKTLDQSLQMVPGMNVYQTQKGQAGFTLRGFRQSKIVILVDGLPFEEIYDGGGGDISRIPVMNASKIIVNRGVSSALYGARGTFGTINVVTKKPEEMYTNVSAEYGEHNNYLLNVSHGAPIGDFYYWLTASMMNSDGYNVSKKLDADKRKEWFKKLTNSEVYGAGYDYDTIYAANAALRTYINGGDSWDHTEYRKYFVSGKAGYNFTDSLEAGVSASYYQNKQLFLGFYPNALNAYEITAGGVGQWKADPTTANIFEQRAWEWSDDYRYDVSPYIHFESGDLSVRASIFYVSQMNNLYYWRDLEHTQIYSNGWKPSKHYEASYGFYIYPTYKLASWNKLSAVLHYRNENFIKEQQDMVALVPTGSYYKVRDMDASYITVGIEDEMKFNTQVGDIGITVGASYDAQKFDRFKKRSLSTDPYADGLLPDEDSMLWGTVDSINPVAGVIYEPLKNFLVVRSSAGMKVEFPSLSQISDNDKASVTEELQPERSINYNIGFELFFLDKAISFRSDYFYTQFRDKLEKFRDPAGGPDLVTNIDGRTMQGVENTVSFNIKNVMKIADVSLSQSYIYTNARDDDDSYVTKGKEVQECPEHQFMTQILFDFITGTSLNIWGTYKMNEKFYVMQSNPGGAVATPGDYSTDYYKTVELHDPLIFNVKLSQKIMEKFEIYVLCKNVLDDYNADPFNPGPGRMFYMGGSAEF
ncbi:MAG TPA: TonB-dependent receptor plug domain-containing protein [Spirochaetota bacterium]|nr:TonB-dependent receptor plug domain-containing protein [Spirochaetota bacterium]